MTSIKITVLGIGAVGKSCLSIRFIRDIFLDDYEPTISDNYQKTINIEGKSYVVDILDTAGMENNSVLQNATIKQRDCFILVYSIADRASFDSIGRIYDDIVRIKELNENDNVPCILCANKVDLPERHVDTADGQELADKIHAIYLETSAKTGYNVDKAIMAAVNEVIKKFPTEPAPKPPKKPWCNIL